MARSAELRALAERAAEALTRGDLDVAGALYRRLEDAEPDEPEWPRHLATIHGRRGDGTRELDALLRSAERHALRGEVEPAAAKAEMILSIDPGHGGAQALLARVKPGGATVSVTYDPDPAPRRRAPRRRAAARPAALDELVLTDVVEGSRPARAADGELDGVHEIPLDVVVPSSPAPARRAAAGAAKSADPAIVRALADSAMFRGLPEATLSKLAARVRVVDLAAGEELFHQGDPAGELYIVARGAVVPIAEEEPRTRLAVLEQGEIFGEIALFTDQPRNATVEALVDTRLLEIDREVTWHLVRRHPELLSMLLEFLRDRLIGRLVRTSPLFKIFSSTKRSAIAGRFRFLEVADGHCVVEQHRPAEGVFILLSGIMEVVHAGEEGEKVLATIGPGDLFGEMSLLSREPSLASVVARSKCWLLSLPSQSFQQLLDHHPQLAALAAKIADERRAKNQRTLRDALRNRDGTAGIF